MNLLLEQSVMFTGSPGRRFGRIAASLSNVEDHPTF
jgi:hypothetical protein